MRRLLITLIAVFQFIACNTNKKNKQPVDYVNPNIGTIGHLLVSTASVVQLPHGTLQLGQNSLLSK